MSVDKKEQWQQQQQHTVLCSGSDSVEQIIIIIITVSTILNHFKCLHVILITFLLCWQTLLFPSYR